ncbi:MAG TPA: HIT family protein [Bryobacteraceae bacterium]|nr:HIT family protein [Bryobacteraceae bacterium]
MPETGCIFCKIIAGDIKAATVYEDENVTVFLDNGPLFPGHALVCPRVHYDTIMDVPPETLQPLFAAVQLTARAVESGLSAEGSFIAVNNKISQSVPHLHVHVVPRRKGDGLKGFFWPRRPYKDEAEMQQTRDLLRIAIEKLRT